MQSPSWTNAAAVCCRTLPSYRAFFLVCHETFISSIPQVLTNNRCQCHTAHAQPVIRSLYVKRECIVTRLESLTHLHSLIKVNASSTMPNINGPINTSHLWRRFYGTSAIACMLVFKQSRCTSTPSCQFYTGEQLLWLPVRWCDNDLKVFSVRRPFTFWNINLWSNMLFFYKQNCLSLVYLW